MFVLDLEKSQSPGLRKPIAFEPQSYPTVVVSEYEKEEDEDKSDTKITMEVLQEIANSINPMIKLTVDTPCNYEDGKMPALDIKVNINLKKNNRIDY